MITKEQFQHFWKDNYGNLPPVGYVLRARLLAERWFRIHSLPNSKRYADSDKEMRIILNRQNALISDLIGDKHNYILMLAFFSNSANPDLTSIFKTPNLILLDSIRLNSVMPDFFDEELYLFTGLLNRVWETGSIDDYLKHAADNGRFIAFNCNACDLCVILLVDIENNRIIAPYDGGVDIFLRTQSERDNFKAKYKDWLSPIESGL